MAVCLKIMDPDPLEIDPITEVFLPVSKRSRRCVYYTVTHLWMSFLCEKSKLLLAVNYSQKKKNSIEDAWQGPKYDFGSEQLHFGTFLSDCFCKKVCNKNIYLYVSANIYLLKVNNRSKRKRCQICSKLAIKSPERRLTSFWWFHC